MNNGPVSAGVWVAYYGDWSDVVVFDDELLALRYAVDHQMNVKLMAFGVSVREQA